MTHDRGISELAAVTFTGSLSEAFKDYSEELYALARHWQFELDMAASDAQAAMEQLRGHPLLFGVDTRLKARRVARRLKRAQNLAHGLAEEAKRFNTSYRHHFLGR